MGYRLRIGEKMADDKSTEVAEPVKVAEAPAEAEIKDTEQDEDIDLEDIEVDPKDLESNDDESDEESEDEESEAESEESEESEEDTEEEMSEEERQKAFNKEMAERRIQEKKAREQSIKERQEEYLTEAEDARDLALRQLQVDAYNNKVERNSNSLTNGYEKALKDFDVLRDSSPEIQAELDQALDAFQAMYVTIDAYGNPIDVKGDLYKYLQSKADSIAKLTGIGARQQIKSKSKEKSKTITTPTRTPKEPKKDADLEAFDEEASKW